MALARLVSMGVEHAKAKLSLQKTGNDVDKAMIWLSTAGANATEEDKSSKSEGQSEEEKKEEESDASGSKSIGKAREETAAEDEDAQMEDAEPESEDNTEWEAQELLYREVGKVLEASGRDLEREYLGKSLDEEWKLILKYRQ